MFRRAIVAVLMVGLLPMTTSAEIYKYRDADGVMRYTDNYLEVPEDQRSNTQSYQEITTPQASPSDAEAEADQEPSLEDMQVREQALRTEKKRLDQVYQQLAQERAKLEEEAKIPKSPEENEAFAQKVDDYNERIRVYEEDRKALKQQIDAFNAMIMAQ